MQPKLVAFFRDTFLAHGPQRYAVMQPASADRKYHDHTGTLTDEQIAAHLAGRATYAVPYAHAGLGNVLALDGDAGGRPAIEALLAACQRRALRAFGQYDPVRERGYVWVVVDELVNVERLHALGDELISQVAQPGWCIENRATHEDTRLPFGRHQWSKRRGLLLFDGQALDLDHDHQAALDQFMRSFRPNPAAQLPPPPAPAPVTPPQPHRPQAGGQIDIARFNAEHDLLELLISYGAKRAGRSLYLCPFHDDRHASLSVFQSRSGVLMCHCKSKHSSCPAAERPIDAFGAYCIHEALTPADALRRLNGREDGPQTPPAGPGAPRRGGGGTPPSPRQAQAPQRPAQRTTTSPEAIHETRQTVQLAAATDPLLTRSAQRVLRVLLDSTPALSACQSLSYYSQHSGCSERTTRYALRLLEQRGYLFRTNDRGHQGETNVYRIQLPQQGGQISAPTCNQESDPTLEFVGAGRGGQPPGAVAEAPAEEAAPAPEAESLLAGTPGAELEPPATQGDEPLHGPAGALAYPGGAAWVPPLPEAERWYASVVAQLTAAARVEADDQAEQHRLVPEDRQDRPVLYAASSVQPPAPDPAPAASGRPIRRRTRQRCDDPNRLRGRIIAAERKAARLEKGSAAERRQARAIRAEVERLRYRLELVLESLADDAAETPAQCGDLFSALANDLAVITGSQAEAPAPAPAAAPRPAAPPPASAAPASAVGRPAPLARPAQLAPPPLPAERHRAGGLPPPPCSPARVWQSREGLTTAEIAATLGEDLAAMEAAHAACEAIRARIRATDGGLSYER